jgi:hypothetical protein
MRPTALSVVHFEEQRREMIATIRVIAKHLVAEIGKTTLDDRVLRAMAKALHFRG